MNKDKYLIPASIIISALIIVMAWIYNIGTKQAGGWSSEKSAASLGGLVLPAEGVVLPIKWGSLGKKMIEAGVIDAEKFEAVYAGRGGLSEKERKLLSGEDNGNLVVGKENAGFVLNLLWAFGLANKNPILEEGPMMDARYGGAGNFASTGGWTLGKSNAMNYYSRYPLVVLTKEQQLLVENVSKNIYRPCCNNPTYFPDCNHGMAMLGLLELLASQNISEEEMYRTALRVNSLWFPDTYATIAEYLKSKGVAMEDVNPKEILGPNFSSYSGFSRILAELKPSKGTGGASCGV